MVSSYQSYSLRLKQVAGSCLCPRYYGFSRDLAGKQMHTHEAMHCIKILLPVPFRILHQARSLPHRAAVSSGSSRVPAQWRFAASARQTAIVPSTRRPFRSPGRVSRFFMLCCLGGSNAYEVDENIGMRTNWMNTKSFRIFFHQVDDHPTESRIG